MMFTKQQQFDQQDKNIEFDAIPNTEPPNMEKNNNDIPWEMMDMIQNKMDMMQEEIRRNKELVLMSNPVVNNNTPIMSYADIKAEIEQKTKVMNLSEPNSESISWELQSLLSMLEKTQEHKDEKFILQQQKRKENEHYDKLCLEHMDAKYSKQNLSNQPELEKRMKAIPALQLITMDPTEIMQKHANYWKFLILNGLTEKEMRAIRANLPHFARNQFQQLAWCNRMDDMIDKLQNTSASNKKVKKSLQIASM